MVIFCGHFPDGAEKFTREEYEAETHAEWYLRQMLGSANFHAGPLMAFMSGNLCYQIEHHLFPDLPSNRYAEIGVACQGAVRQVRPALHDGIPWPAVHAVVLDDPQAGAAQQASRRRRPMMRPKPTPS